MYILPKNTAFFVVYLVVVITFQMKSDFFAVFAAPTPCTVFPPTNPLNSVISKNSIDGRSRTYIRSMNKNGNTTLKLGFGLPVNIVGKGEAKVKVNVTAYPAESDSGPYPIPPNAKIQSTPDHHLSVLDTYECKLYELYQARFENGSWYADSASIFNLRSNTRRHEGWTSADAAGLPIYPLVIKYSEVRAGIIRHAIRVTADETQHAYIHPATHASGEVNSSLPPMGLRLRLKRSYDISKFPHDARVILQAMKDYGLIVADSGTSWTIGGEESAKWNWKDLRTLEKVRGTAFEVVRTGSLHYPK